MDMQHARDVRVSHPPGHVVPGEPERRSQHQEPAASFSVLVGCGVEVLDAELDSEAGQTPSDVWGCRDGQTSYGIGLCSRAMG